MKPYYEHAGITIYHGDCRELVPELKADVLITDPPYGVNFSGKKTKHTVASSGGYLGVDDAEIGPAVVAAILPSVKRGAVFTGIASLQRYPVADDIGCIYCPSGAGIGKWGFVCFHPIAFYGKRAQAAVYPTSRQSFAVNDVEGHPCPKPLEWLLWLTKLATNDGDVVLDPFAGSGTTLEATKALSRQAIGIEIEERYCEIAAKRLSQEVLAF